jgi:NAD dependent epimerase/dehydratase family enzyme
MKIILTGSTGFVGGEVLNQAVANDKLDHIFVLSRKELPKELASSDKISVFIHRDFSEYSEDLLAKLAGAEACLWY